MAVSVICHIQALDGLDSALLEAHRAQVPRRDRLDLGVEYETLVSRIL